MWPRIIGAWLFAVAVITAAWAANPPDLLLLHVGSVPGGGGGGGGCCTLVNHVSNTASNSPSTATLNVTGGNLLVVGAWHDGTKTNAITCTDTASNTFTSITSQTGFDGGGATGNVTIFYAKSVTGNSSDVISCADSAGNSIVRGIIVHQYSGANASTPSDTNAGAENFGGTSVTSSSFSTATAKEALVGFTANTTGSLTCTAGSGYTQIETTSDGHFCSEHEFVTSTQSSVTTTQTVSSSANLAIVVGTFQ